jgi:hypothetical protein
MMPFAAIWFPERRTIIASSGASGGTDLLCELDAVERLGPRASNQRRRFWRLPTQRVAQITVADASQHELLRAGDTSTIPLVLDAAFRDESPLIFVLCSDGRSSELMEAQFVSDARWQEPLELHDLLRLLGPRAAMHVDGVWHSPVCFDGQQIRIGPAQAIPFISDRLTVQIEPPACTPGPTCKLALAVKLTSLTKADSGPERAPLHAGSKPILLVWRSVFAERLTTASRPFVQGFRDHVQTFLGQSIAFARTPSSGMIRSPIVRGDFSLRPETRRKDDVSETWEFDGPIDIRDVLVLCMPRRSHRLVELRYDGEPGLAPVRDIQQGIELDIFCWRAELDRLTPVAWDDLAPDMRAAFAERLGVELKTADSKERDTGSLAGTAAVHRHDRPSDAAISAIPRAVALEHGKVFTAAEALIGTIDEWFATLDREAVEKLCARSGPAVEITNLARFLPLALHEVPHGLASWTELERDAAALHAVIAALAGLLHFSIAGSEHLRGDTRIWESLKRAVETIGPADARQLIALLEAFGPDLSGALAILMPDVLGRTASLLEKLESELSSMAREADSPRAVC